MKKFLLLMSLTIFLIAGSVVDTSGDLKAQSSEQMVVGRKYDTGKKWTDGSIIYKKLVSIGALPNATTKSTAHSADVDVTKYARVSAFIARNGTQFINIPAVTITAINITATNVVIISTTDLSAYTAWVEIEFCE